VRTCVVTREEHGPDALVRLCVGPDGRVEVDYRGKLGGRGAWVLPRREVVAQAEAKPAILRRALDAPEASVEGLLERVRAANLRAMLELLSLAARAGAIAGGAEQVEGAALAGALTALVVATDASERSVAHATAAAPSLPVLNVPLDRDALGQRVGKGPRAVLGLRPSAVTRALLRELRTMEGLR
jgi:predicted RNA-binding protein YlxR (DUF448 family)